MIILKNTTLSTIELKSHGVSIPASSQITINTQDYQLLYDPDTYSELSTYIISGDLLVNNGSIDLDIDTGLAYIQAPNQAKNVLFDDSSSSLVGSTVQEALESISQGTGIPSLANIVYVSKNGNDGTANGFFSKPFLTIEAALSYISINYTPSASNPYLIEVTPGTYDENPLTLPAWVLLRGAGNNRTRINAINPNANLLTITGTTTITDIGFIGVTNSSNWCVSAEFTGDGGLTLFSTYTSLNSNGFKFSSTSGELNVFMADYLSTNFTGISVQTGSNVTSNITNPRIRGTGTAVVQFDNAIVNLKSALIEDCSIGVSVMGNTGKMIMTSVTLENCTTSLQQTGTSEIQLLGGNFDASTASIIDTSVIKGYWYNELIGEQQFRVINELSVGLPGNGSESAFGEGDSYYNGMQVFTYNGSTYNNVTSNAKDPTTGTFSIPNTSVNSALYVSTAFPDLNGNFQRFPGIKIGVTTAAVWGAGEIVAEYWNGSSWVEFNHMSMNEAQGEYYKFGKVLFARVGDEQIKFNPELESNNWTANDPVSLGINLYWVRFRIVTAITTAPSFQYIKIHTDRTELNGDGYLTAYGQARFYNFISNDIRFEAVVNVPADQNVYLSDNLGVGKSQNEFFSAGLLTNSDQAGAVFNLPSSTDTSGPAILSIKYYSTDTGTLSITIYWSNSRDGDTIYESRGAAPSVGIREQSMIVTDTYSVANRQKTLRVPLDISDFIPRSSTNDQSDLFWIGIRINNNTTLNPMTIINISLETLRDEIGEHL